MSSPLGRTSSLERGPSSSAYFSASSPRIDTAYSSSYAATPSPFASGNAERSQSSPRSPPLVAHVQQSSYDTGAYSVRSTLQQQPTSSTASTDQLRSPRLVQTAASAHHDIDLTPISSVGYTIAQYGSNSNNSASTPYKSYGVEKKKQQETTPPLKYFDKIDYSSQVKNQLFLPESQTAQFEMTRSAELTLFRSPPVFYFILTFEICK